MSAIQLPPNCKICLSHTGAKARGASAAIPSNSCTVPTQLHVIDGVTFVAHTSKSGSLMVHPPPSRWRPAGCKTG